MAGPVQQLDVWVLAKRPPSDTFQTLTLFSAAHGAAYALQRLSRKSTPVAALDLFDEASVRLEEPIGGQAAFVKEARVLTRHTDIGKSYDALRLASAFATLVARNPVGQESRAAVFDLVRQAFAAFAGANRPDIVYLKSVYRFCRDEGYPVKQDWVPGLPPSDRAAVTELLNQPLSAQTLEPKTVARLQRRLEDYLRGHTEILLD